MLIKYLRLKIKIQIIKYYETILILKFAIIMLKLNIYNETSELAVVVLGIANDFGGTPNIEDCYDPKSKEHVISGTFPYNLISLKK